jgi:predicted adenylyl cyclase CyaB
MPANIEIKATLKDRSKALAIATRLADSGPEIIHQEDVFLRCEGARLKLRIFDSTRGELIRYHRENRAEVRRSHYTLARTSDPEALRGILAETLGVVGVVKKTRTFFIAGQTRIHIDQVEGLGDFLEFEVVLRERQEDEDGKQIAKDLLAKFGISSEDLLAKAYIDMLQELELPATK